VAWRVCRGTALLFHDCSTRSMPWPYFTPGEDLVPIVQEAGWAPGPVRMGGKSRPHWDSISDRPASNKLLYQMIYPAHNRELLHLLNNCQTTLHHRDKYTRCPFHTLAGIRVSHLLSCRGSAPWSNFTAPELRFTL